MKKIQILLVLFCFNYIAFSQAYCTSFESDLAGFQAYHDVNNPYSEINYCRNDINVSGGGLGILDMPFPTSENPVVRVSASDLDPNIPISPVFSGDRAIRMNPVEPENTDIHETHLVRYFTAQEGITSISFKMAYVIEALAFDISNSFDGSHNEGIDEDAYIRASINVGTLSNSEITTPESRFCLRANIYDCQFIEGTPDSGAYYTNWQTVTLEYDPTPYLGQLLRLDIEVADCSIDEHYSYAYIDDICTPEPEDPTSILCCYDEDTYPIFDLVPECIAPLGGNCTLCENPNDNIRYKVYDALGQQVNNTTYPGIDFSWQSASGVTGTNQFFDIIPGDNTSVTLTLGACSITLESDFNCIDEPSCEDCDTLGIEIFNSIEMVPKGECGEYQMTVPIETFDCYTTQINTGDGSGWITVNQSDLMGELYIFDYDQDGPYSLTIRLIDTSSGPKEVCYINKRKIIVDCCELSCKDVTTGIIAIDTGQYCGGQYFVPFGTNECYSVFLTYLNDDPIPFLHEINDGWTDFYYGAYDIIVVENSTGLVCGELTDFPTPTGCLTGPSDEEEIEKFISLYPNPFTNQFTIKNDSNIAIKQIKIYNIFGNLIKKQTYSNGEYINIDNGVSGLYFVKVYLENETVETIRLIKE